MTLILFGLIVFILVLLWVNSKHYGKINAAKWRRNRQRFYDADATLGAWYIAMNPVKRRFRPHKAQGYIK